MQFKLCIKVKFNYWYPLSLIRWVCVCTINGVHVVYFISLPRSTLECVLATPTKNCFGCWSLVLLFRLNDNRVVSSVTVLVMTSETVFGWSPKRTPDVSSGWDPDKRNRPYACDVMWVEHPRLDVKRRLFIGQSYALHMQICACLLFHYQFISKMVAGCWTPTSPGICTNASWDSRLKLWVEWKDPKFFSWFDVKLQH